MWNTILFAVIPYLAVLIAVVGGMLFATGLTLYVVPAVYSYLSRGTKVAGAFEPVVPAAEVGSAAR